MHACMHACMRTHTDTDTDTHTHTHTVTDKRMPQQIKGSWSLAAVTLEHTPKKILQLLIQHQVFKGNQVTNFCIFIQTNLQTEN